MATDPEEVRVNFTPEAAGKLKEVLAAQDRPMAGLRLEIASRGPGGFEHVLSLLEAGAEQPGDLLVEVEGIPVYVEGRNARYLDGVTVHYQYKGPNISGLEFENPNPIWIDEKAERIQQLIDEYLNPAIAAHGGYVTLLDVRDNVAYVRLGGGCVGCGMADVTLKQGIEVAIKEAVPEIDQVVDETDHASGTNPYYTPAKK